MFTGAKWIWTQEEIKNQYIEIRCVFDHAGDADAAKLAVSADNEYFAYINGAYAGGGQYDDFPMHKAYNIHDVSALVKQGENELVIRAYHQGEKFLSVSARPSRRDIRAHRRRYPRRFRRRLSGPRLYRI